MFDDLPPDLDRLHTLRVWHALWLDRIERKIAWLERRKAEEEHGRRTRPRPPEWVVEIGIGVGKPGFAWAGEKKISAKKEWPDWTPPPEMLERRPDLLEGRALSKEEAKLLAQVRAEPAEAEAE